MRKVWWSLLLALLAVLGWAWVRWALPRLERRLHGEIERAATERLGRPVRIDALRLHPLLIAAALEDVRVPSAPGADDLLFACRRWTVYLTPVHRASRFPWFSLSLGRSRVEAPVLAALPPSATPGSAAPKLSVLPFHRLEWEDGVFHLPAFNALPAFTLADCSGAAVLSAGEASIEVSGGTPWGDVRLAGRAGESLLRRKPLTKWKAVLLMPRARLEALAPLLPQGVSGGLGGTASVSLRLQGDRALSRVDDWEAAIEFADASWTLDRLPWALSGRLTVSPEVAQARDLSLGGVRLDGRVRDPFGERRADLTARADGFPLETLQGRLPMKALSVLPWRGAADLSARVKGPLSSPQVSATLEGRDAGAGFLVLPEVSVSFSHGPEGSRLSAALREGSLTAERSSAGRWEGHIEAVSLDALSRAGGWGQIGGRLSGDFAFEGSSDTLAGGILRWEIPSWGDHRLQQTLLCYFSWKGGSIRFRNKSETLDVLAEKAPDGWRLTRLAYAREDGFSVLGEGAVSGPQRALRFQVAVRQAALRDIPALLARYPALDGRFGADLAVVGTFARPEATLALSGGGARLAAEGPLHGFSARARWDGRLSLESLSIDDAWTCAALRTSDGEWQVSAAARGADAALAGEILRSATPVAGTVDARLSLSGRPGEWSGSFNGALSAFRRGPVSFARAEASAAWAPGRISAAAVDVDGKAFRGEARRRSPGRWSAEVSGPVIGTARGEVLIGGRAWVLDGWALGDGLSLRGRGTAAGLFARLSAQDAPAAALAARAGLPATRGRVSGDLVVEGPWQSLAGRLEASWRGARFRGAEWDVDLSARGDGRSVSLEALRADSSSGTVAASGTAPWTADGPLALSVRGRRLAASLAGPFLSGAWDGDVTVTGSRAAPEATIAVRSEGLSAWGAPPFAFSSSATWRAGALTFAAARAHTADGQLILRPGSAVRLVEGGADFDAGADLRNVRPGPLTFFGGLDARGSWRRGPPGRLSVSLRARELWLNQQLLDGELAHAAWSEGLVVFEAPDGAFRRLTGAVRLDGWPSVGFEDVSLWEGAERRLLLKGRAGGSGAWDFSVEGHGVEAGTLLSLADADLSAEGKVDFFMAVGGSAGDPRVEAEVVGAGGRVEGVPYDALRAAVDWDRRRWALRELSMSRRRGYLLSGRGEMKAPRREGEAGEPRFLFQLTEGNFAILKDLWAPCRKAHGAFQGELTVGPGEEGPAVSGHFRLAGAGLRAERFVRSVEDLTVDARFDGNALVLEDVSGRVGRGRFVMGGTVRLAGFRPAEYDVFIRTVGRRGVSIEVPQLAVPPGPLLNRFSLLRRTLQAVSQGEPRLDLTVKGEHGDHVVAGTLVLDQTQFTYPPLPGAFRGDRGSWWSEFWREAVWDVDLRTGDDTWYRNEYVNAHVDGGLKIRGPRDALRVDGRLVADQGVVNYLSQPFEIRRAAFELITDVRPAVSDGGVLAYISGEAERTATTLDARGVPSLDTITMIIPRARLGEMRPRFVSRNNPDLPSDRVFQKLLGFSAPDALHPPTAEEQDQLLRAGLVQLVGSSAGPFAGRLARLFGIDMISAIYEPATPSVDPARAQSAARPAAGGRWSDLLRGTGAAAGLRLSDRVFGLYKFTVDRTIQNRVFLHDELQVVGRVAGQMYLKFSSELDARSILGQPPNRQVLLERQWRFGLPRRKPKKETTDPTP